LRGQVSTQRSAVLTYDDSDNVLDYVGRERTGAVSQLGAACPDHLIHVKRQPLFVDWAPAEGADTLKTRLEEGIADYKTRYNRLLQREPKRGRRTP